MDSPLPQFSSAAVPHTAEPHHQRPVKRIAALIASVVVGSLGLFLSLSASKTSLSADLHNAESELSVVNLRSSSASPHIFFVLADDLGYGDFGPGAEEMADVPLFLNSLMDNSVVLHRYYAMQLCTPSRTVLLTGKNAHRLGMQYENIKPDMSWGLSLQETLLPEILKETHGYETHIVGKWNQGHAYPDQLPNSRGFDSFVGYLTDEIEYYTHAYPQTLGDATYFDFHETDESEVVHPLEVEGEYSLDTYTNRIQNIVKNNADSSKPLFIYYASQLVHGPMDNPPDKWVSSRVRNLLEMKNLTWYRKRMGRMIAALDRSLETIVDTFKDEGLWSNTIMVFASDNGACHTEGGSNGVLRGGKHWLFEGGVRVPAFVYNTHYFGSGRAYHNYFHVADWAPTLLDMMGVDTPTKTYDLDGVSHWRNLKDGSTTTEAPREEILLFFSSYTTCCNFTSGDVTVEQCSGFLAWCDNEQDAVITQGEAPRGAIIVGDMKLILNEYDQPWFSSSLSIGSKKQAESDANAMQNCGNTPTDLNLKESFLFNITADPEERVNLIDTKPKVAAAMRARLFSYEHSESHPAWTPGQNDCLARWNSEDNFISPWL